MPSALPDFVRVELAEWRVSKYASMSEGPARADGHAADGDLAGGIGCYDVNSSRRHRRSVRLAGYDYSQPGAYFVTICAQDRSRFFGEVVGGQMHLNEPGRMIVGQWTALPQRFPVVCLDAFVVMPNHLHGILIIRHVGAPLVGALVGARNAGSTGTMRAATDDDQNVRRQPGLGDIVGAFKSISTVEYGRGVRAEGWPCYRDRLWQRDYHEHIIRDEDSLNRIRLYITANPVNWSTDRENPTCVAPHWEPDDGQNPSPSEPDDVGAPLVGALFEGGDE